MRYQRRQNGMQNTTFCNAINGILEFEQKPTKQQPKLNDNETKENREQQRPDYKAFQAA